MAFKVSTDANLLLNSTLQRDNYIHPRNIIQQGIDGKVALHTTSAVSHITACWLTKFYGAV